MIYGEKSIADILGNRKTMTRRLVKEGDFKTYNGVCNCKKEKAINSKVVIIPIKLRKRWRVGKDYSVQAKRGGKGLWYCRVCKKIGENCDVCYKQYELDVLCNNSKSDFGNVRKMFEDTMLPLRFVVVSIKQEKLFDISQEDAKREGYSSRLDFLVAFNTLNNKQYSKSKGVFGELSYGKVIDEALFWNPLVWVLEFKVKGVE